MKHFVLFSFSIPIIILGLAKHHRRSLPDDLSIGDSITTVGGVTGEIVDLSDGFVTIKTAEDQVLIQCSRWAIQTAATNM